MIEINLPKNIRKLEIIKWLISMKMEDTLESRYTIHVASRSGIQKKGFIGYKITFKEESEAILFKLVWC